MHHSLYFAINFGFHGISHISYFRYRHDFGDGDGWYLDGAVNNLFQPDSDQFTSVGRLYNEL